ncbi:uncharacterized protein LOC105433522 [Pogonomyrmex barbatus]|uniref:Uncharacterized protein LOC105433522 n=1 Tax=Pogonomyrmex barbatus TaxID=144034 RepID=A0A6I9WT36_9HYME|nr:uncharacterized protein LOC105433522 [Pogonomyrmex barbatus]
MNKLREAEISASFHRNILLLTRMVPPSSEFQRHFKKGMFNKPNTTGFLHVSHYLSTVYDARLFKQMVRWPILCKRDETTYRVEMKNFLNVLSRDNPDLGFPSVLMSHLIQSGGTKFQIIMWKLSQLALKTYLTRELQGELLNAPRSSPAQDLTIAYFNNIIAQKCDAITETCKETKKTADAVNDFLNDEIKILNLQKSEIFDRKENIKRLVLGLLAHPLIQRRLMDIDDLNVTDLWKRSIFKKIQYIYKKNKEFDELEESCNLLCKLILRISSNPGTLDADKLPEIRCTNHLLCTESEIQYLIRNSHVDGSIVFSALLSLLYLASTQILYRINIADFPDLSRCTSSVQNACKKMKSLQTLFGALIARIDGVCRDEQCAFWEMKNACNFNKNSILIANRNILLQSPKINFNLGQCMDDYRFYEKLYLSPMEGRHKHLFKRYKRECYRLRELPTVLSDFSKSWSNMNGWLSPRIHVKCEQTLFKGKPLSPLYSRLLNHSKWNLNRSRGDVSCSPSANYEGLNLTPMKHSSKAGHLTMNGYTGRPRDLFSSAIPPALSHVSSNTENVRNARLVRQK